MSVPIWAKHEFDRKWHLVLRVADSSVQTRCSGRWSTADSYSIHNDPPASDRCGGCEARDRAPLFQFDQSEDE